MTVAQVPVRDEEEGVGGAPAGSLGGGRRDQRGDQGPRGSVETLACIIQYAWNRIFGRSFAAALYSPRDWTGSRLRN